MSDKAEADVHVVAAEIVQYLRVHPSAADTIEGAAHWWLGWRPPSELMESAMALLVGQQLVERHTLAEGTTVYRKGPRLTAIG